jgi:serine/threonine protein kinase
MVKKAPWDDNWTIERPLGAGGHGETFLVRNKSGDGQLYVLKKLRNQKSLERRERMHREVRAFNKLDQPGIPKVYGGNTDDFGDVDVPLFFVAEYIEGSTLEQVVENNTLDLISAIKLALRLADIVNYCHRQGVHHRDIKADNIILRKGDLNDPVLIDFGQSFNEDDTGERLTKFSQQLGNRCLHLPELESGDSEKRYVESDITQCCSVLFYALTGKCPVHLSDQEGRKPHQRPFALEKFRLLSPAVRLELNKVFDKGFNQTLTSRFRSFGAFTGKLHEVLDVSRTVSESVAMQNTKLEHLYEDILLLIDELVDRDDYAGAAALTRSFLGIGQPEKALKIVERMEVKGGTKHPNYFLVLANKAYVKSNLGQFQEVINLTDELFKLLKEKGERLAAYQALVRANAHMSLGHKDEALQWVARAKVLPQYGNEREKSKKIYPAIAEYLTED